MSDINANKPINKIKYNKTNFVNASNVIINKIKSHRNIYLKNSNDKKIKYNSIYGYIEISKTKIKKFKIIDKSLEEEIYTKDKKISKRTLITGRDCSTYQVSQLESLRRKMDLYEFNSKRKIQFICNDLEIFLRYKQYIETKNIIWFIFNK